MKNKDKKCKKSFSLGEVLLSVFILGVTMVSILQLFVVGLKNIYDTRDSIIASMLAQEGIELVKNIRDNNWVNGRDSFDGLNPGPPFNTCIIDVESGSCSPVVCVGGATNNCSLRYDEAKELYLHTSGSQTKFKRVIVIGINPNFKTVFSKVSWDPGADFSVCDVAHKCVFSQTTLTKWGE